MHFLYKIKHIFWLQGTEGTIMALTTAIIITLTLKIYVELILPPILSGITSITPASSNNSILAGVSAIIQRIEPVFTPVVVPATTGAPWSFLFTFFVYHEEANSKKNFNTFEHSFSHFHGFSNLRCILDFFQSQVHVSIHQTRHSMFRILDSSIGPTICGSAVWLVAILIGETESSLSVQNSWAKYIGDLASTFPQYFI